jgi:uncharacterized protein
MSEQENERVVREMYAAFGRGDVPAVLDSLAEDVEWRIAGPSELPFAGTHRGRGEVARFFETFGRSAEFEVFEPREFLSRGDTVVVLGHERQRVLATGVVFETDWAMVFTVVGGKIARYRNFVDTHTVAAAHRGV